MQTFKNFLIFGSISKKQNHPQSKQTFGYPPKPCMVQTIGPKSFLDRNHFPAESPDKFYLSNNQSTAVNLLTDIPC